MDIAKCQTRPATDLGEQAAYTLDYYYTSCSYTSQIPFTVALH